MYNSLCRDGREDGVDIGGMRNFGFVDKGGGAQSWFRRLLASLIPGKPLALPGDQHGTAGF